MSRNKRLMMTQSRSLHPKLFENCQRCLVKDSKTDVFSTMTQTMWESPLHIPVVVKPKHLIFQKWSGWKVWPHDSCVNLFPTVMHSWTCSVVGDFFFFYPLGSSTLLVSSSEWSTTQSTQRKQTNAWSSKSWPRRADFLYSCRKHFKYVSFTRFVRNLKFVPSI